MQHQTAEFMEDQQVLSRLSNDILQVLNSTNETLTAREILNRLSNPSSIRSVRERLAILAKDQGVLDVNRDQPPYKYSLPQQHAKAVPGSGTVRMDQIHTGPSGEQTQASAEQASLAARLLEIYQAKDSLDAEAREIIQKLSS